MNEIISKLDNSYFNLIESHKKIKNKIYEFELPSKSAIEDYPDLNNFYKETNGLKLQWDFDVNRNLCGRMNLIRLEYVLESWEEKLYYEGADQRLKHFRPLDVFTEEACCGILLDGSGDPTMYYHDFGTSTIYSLDIDFKSYFDLSIDTLAFLYWQTHLVDLVNGDQGVEILFRTGMKEVFPDFDLDAFTEKFEGLRLSKK